ncbi:hypothetical protein GCK72_019996 [Caenorhabditis remanei]|uniref:NR LBD domain-containing protein n=1 Tax=Caenorhabditis remanei TaxID=31234 RepID=A0A6A5GGA9_CAERE|nr:hypothetical protein GCK72_019996 [Caenorhabditis remanei]KAF1753439.1 hypothetical protein GCK72_019996 [Caenorhabditis remanei]
MAYALEDMHITRNETKVEFQTKVGKFELFSFWEDSFIKTVQWFSKFPEFTELDMEVKLDILKSSWLIWIRLDKQAHTANLQRKQLLGANVYMTGEGRCMNLKNFDVDLSFATNYSMDQIRSLMNVDVDTTWKPSVDALIKLDPTNVELNFMLIQLCLNYAQKKFPGKTREAIEKLLQIQADNLHDYYVKTMKTPNYSGRLTKMMKIIQFIEADVRRQQERFYLAKVFDIFTVDFSHPEMVEMF